MMSIKRSNNKQIKVEAKKHCLNNEITNYESTNIYEWINI